MNYTFELKELQATHIVYLHHQGDMSMIPSSIRKLMQWARPKGLINGPANKLISVYQHEGKELSVDIGLTVPQEVEGERACREPYLGNTIRFYFSHRNRTGITLFRNRCEHSGITFR